ncbi:MAG TPA: DEAD/DEAH box helicase [Streptosporangiaceae bacterium]|nr:DEAD/DEAH box helicase [Streptosporangiaceae bacterium]
MTILLAGEPAQNTTRGIAPTFDSLGVPRPLVATLARAGITTAFPIQAATLPDALAGLDILGQGNTGSGKTLGYSLPLVARLADGHTTARHPRGLVLVPTRELASQVREVLLPLAKVMGLTVTTVFGGTAQRSQVAALRDRADIVVACPGRLADLIEQGHCHLGDVEVTVLDEADQMADLGFLPVVRRLLEATPADGQRMLFSATLDDAVSVLARRFLNEPARHTVDAATPPGQMTHHLLTVSPGDRLAVVRALAGGRHRSLVFTRTRHGARKLARQLAESGVPAVELHGDLPQNARTRNLAAFSTGAVRVMVATDIAARGIHVDDIGLVIHADSPAEHKAYLHRAGRTARAGAAGVVITLQTPSQGQEVRRLMRRADVVPLTAAADPHSPVLRSIAGPPAERVAPTRPRRDAGRPPSPGVGARTGTAAKSAGRRGHRSRPR